MLRVLVLAGSAAALAGLSFVIFSGADSQVQAKGLVVLQPTTPGTAQVGNANLSGKLIAGQFQGVGSGLTGVDADLLDGLNSTAFLQSIPVPLLLNGTSATHIIRAENASTAVGSSAVSGISTATSGGAYGVFGRTDSSSGRGVYGLATAFGGSYAGYFLNQGNNFAVYAESLVGGVHGKATSSSASSYGLFGESSSTAQGSGGVWGTSYATTGETYGVSGYSQSSTGAGVYGSASSFSGANYGGYFESRSSTGIGVYGEATRSTGSTAGVYGITRSTAGVGVYGVAPVGGTSIGVWGIGESAMGWGVYANGRLGASGVKSFRIDHPLNPENKWLLHYCSEGPEPLNVYSGAITADARGFATIELPDYFEEINRDPRVQLTVDDRSEDFVMAKVVGGVKNGVCRIRTSKPHVKVYWEVKAVRNDRWMQKYGAPVEQEKAEYERGKYQHPELYGLPPEMGMTFGRDSRAK